MKFELAFAKKNIIISSILVVLSIATTILLVIMCNNVKKNQNSSETPYGLYQQLQNENKVLECKTAEDVYKKDGTFLFTIFYPSESESFASVKKLNDMKDYDFYVIAYTTSLKEILISFNPTSLVDYWVVDNHELLYSSDSTGKTVENVENEIKNTKLYGLPEIETNSSKRIYIDDYSWFDIKFSELSYSSYSQKGVFDISLRSLYDKITLVDEFNKSIDQKDYSYVIICVTNDYDSTEQTPIETTNINNFYLDGNYNYKATYTGHTYKTIQIQIYKTDVFNTLDKADVTKTEAYFNYRTWM